jgi:hypothetical protein
MKFQQSQLPRKELTFFDLAVDFPGISSRNFFCRFGFDAAGDIGICVRSPFGAIDIFSLPCAVTCVSPALGCVFRSQLLVFAIAINPVTDFTLDFFLLFRLLPQRTLLAFRMI